MARSQGQSPVTGVLLAGGQSRRMGRDKRFLDVGGMPLFHRVLSVFDRLFPEVLVVVADQAVELPVAGHRVLTDRIPGCGSLGGLYTGLLEASHPRVFAAACDMPFLNASLIAHMTVLDVTAGVVMAKLANGVHPMHAVYAKTCLPFMEAMLKSGQLKIQSLVEEGAISVRLLSEEDARAFDPDFLSFLNINTPADLEFARKVARDQPATSG